MTVRRFHGKVFYMAYYGKAKYKFSELINQCKQPASKEFLQTKCRDCFGDEDGYIEQWLYNESSQQIKSELHGFIKGYLFSSKKYCDVDSFMCQQEILPRLASIYIEMNKENDWGDTEELTDWEYWNSFFLDA